jgi:hypothetical protein
VATFLFEHWQWNIPLSFLSACIALLKDNTFFAISRQLSRVNELLCCAIAQWLQISNTPMSHFDFLYGFYFNHII